MDRDVSLSPLGREALDWFVRRAGGLEPAEEAAFQAWLHADPSHADAYAQWQADWHALDAVPADAVERLRRNLAREKASEAARADVGSRHSFFAAGRRFVVSFLSPHPVLVGACLTVVLACGLAWNDWRQPLFSESYATTRGEQTEVTLPDGSRVKLDTDSRVDVALYRGHRDVHLPAGQIRLEVAGDRSRPFDVLAGPLRITVVGTRFAVRYTPGLPGQEGVRIAVEEGRVRVRRDGWFGFGGDVVELTPGQQIASDAAGGLGMVAAVPPSGISPWSNSRVSFDNATLAEVLAEFERYGDTHLVLRDSAAALRLTGTFDPRHPENFVRVLPQALPVHLVQAGDATEIRTR